MLVRLLIKMISIMIQLRHRHNGARNKIIIYINLDAIKQLSNHESFKDKFCTNNSVTIVTYDSIDRKSVV